MYRHDSLVERCKRLWCRWFGHRWVPCARGEPVVSIIDVCKRCGKFERSHFVRGAA